MYATAFYTFKDRDASQTNRHYCSDDRGKLSPYFDPHSSAQNNSHILSQTARRLRKRQYHYSHMRILTFHYHFNDSWDDDNLATLTFGGGL